MFFSTSPSHLERRSEALFHQDGTTDGIGNVAGQFALAGARRTVKAKSAGWVPPQAGYEPVQVQVGVEIV